MNKDQIFQSAIFEECDAAFIISEVNRFYFTKFNSSSGFLILTKDKSILYVDFRYIEAAKAIAQNCEVRLLDKTAETIFEISKEFNIKSVILEENICVSEYKLYKKHFEHAGVNVLEKDTLNRAILNMRAIKAPDELENIKQAQKITDAAFEHILPIIKQRNITEKEIALELEFYMKKHNAESLSFDSIVVSGVNGSKPHGVPTDKKIQDGEFLTIDMGCKYNGYCSDMTRTVAIGEITDEMKYVYSTVLKAQLEALSKIRPGVACSVVDLAARDFIYANGFEGCFGHGTGHCLGIDIHEEPRCSQFSTDILKAGMVTSVEPGIYIEGKYGVRIEDIVFVTNSGFKNLTKSNKELIIL